MFCPWYNLPKAHQMLKEKDFYQDLEIENGYLNVFKKVII
jgi:fatty acid desaturase